MSVASALRRANAKGKPEESIALRVAVLVAVLAATAATLAQGVGGPLLRVGSTVGIAAGFAYSHHARHRDGYVLKALLAVGVLVAFGQFIGATSGLGPGVVSAIQIPLAELFLWVQVLHSADVPARRDLLFSLLSSLVLVAVAGVLSTTTSLAPFLAVWVVAALTALVLAHRSELADHPALQPVRPARPEERGRAAAAPRGSGLRPVLGVVALALTLASVVFLVLPAAGAGRAVAFPARLPRTFAVPFAGGLANPALGGADPASPDGSTSSTGDGPASFGYFGFSTELDTGTRGRPDDTLVMRVRAARPDFWRGQTFDTWDGRTWRQSDQRVRVASGNPPIELVGAPEDRLYTGAGNDVVQTVHVERQGPNLIFAAYSPKQVYFTDRRLFEMSDGTVRTGVHLPKGAVYTVVSRRAPVTAELLRASGDGAFEPDPPALVARYTRLPAGGVPPRVSALARELAAASPNRYDVVRAIEAWMGEHTAYTLDIPPLPPGDDAVERFLFVDRKGFCEQIASSMVVLLRTLGIPARLAVGYAPGTRNPFTGMWEVKANDAHAWAEVWFPGLGWQAFDPTASVPFAGDPFSSSAATGLLAYVRDALPDVPDAVRAVVVTGLATAAPLGAGAWLVAAAARRRRARARRGWPDLVLERLERVGERRGRSRRPWEPASSYADVLARSVLPDARVRAVASALEADAFAPGGGIGAGDRRRTEALLDEIEAAHPA